MSYSASPPRPQTPSVRGPHLSAAAAVVAVLLQLWGASSRTRALVVGSFAAHAVVSGLIQHAWYRYRTGDPLDVIAHWVGIAIGVLALRLILLCRSRGVAEGLAAS
jgi:hypothetical protein